MKKFVSVIVVLLTISLSGFAQQKVEHKRSQEFKIENFVDDLSSEQKKKIDDISSQYMNRISKMRQELKSLRDSIRTISDKYGDNTKTIFPMYEREAKIQTEISKEMYRMKLQLDKVLTKEQYNALHSNLAKKRTERMSNTEVDKEKVEAVKKALQQKRKDNAAKAKGKN